MIQKMWSSYKGLKRVVCLVGDWRIVYVSLSTTAIDRQTENKSNNFTCLFFVPS